MREKLKYFIINKAYDYNRGIYSNMEVRDNSLCFARGSRAGVGRFLTRIFDSGEREMCWHRLVIDTEGCEDEDIRITVYGTDEQQFRYNGKNTDISDIFENKSFSFDQKLKAFSPMIRKQVSGVSDILLHDVSCRYLWVLVEQYSPDASAARINDILIFLPADSWIDKLPGIYRSSDAQTHFLERYLGIFQTFYEELDHEIAEIADRFDPECAESDFLRMMAQWLNIKNTGIWSDEQLRQLLLRAVGLYRMRGTKEGLSGLLEIYLGEKPFIIEGFATDSSDKKEKALAEMYGGSPDTVTVLIKTGHDKEVVRRIAMEMLPATSELRIVELESYIFLDNYAYLGVNSALGKYRPAVLDGRSPLMLSTLGEKKRRKDQDEGGKPEKTGD